MIPYPYVKKDDLFWGAVIAHWIRLRLPSCLPKFESQAHHPNFYQFIFGL